MAVNKNFVVKNGLEVNTDLILADASTNRVGIATTTPGTNILQVGSGSTSFALDAAGNLNVSGVSTFQSNIHVG